MIAIVNRNRWRETLAAAVIAGPALLLGGCINISAPDKPIVIDLNISITQEVVYRLDSKAQSVIQQNPGVF
ncbi:YnbE family lipoprotein [Sphingosinithalassobacter portus]|uniref:YnbE family lipoprotein n=1 Tax=Stakelama portus TaxID=2676234 RepID=UPI000D6E3DE3|nr:YnbE family lipoprotein [Sphingosinithalassobacter portus]